MTTATPIVERISDLAQPLLEEMQVELVEIQFRREAMGWVLRLFIDKQDGISIDDCARVSRQLSAYLEVENLIDHAYTLEVSSPGLERPLKRRQDFIRFAGRKVRVKLREPVAGGKLLVGVLEGLDDQSKVLVDLGAEKVCLEMENIVRARLTLE